MSHYSDDPYMVRVDFFKDSGKWYTTEAVPMTGEWRGGPNSQLYDMFAKAIIEHLTDNGRGSVRLGDMIAVCLNPYHEHAHPLMIPVKRAIELAKRTP
jgi:hypothetical protein